MPEQITLKTTSVNAILQYLVTQPYQSVAGLIQAIQAEAQGQIAEAPAEAVEE